MLVNGDVGQYVDAMGGDTIDHPNEGLVLGEPGNRPVYCEIRHGRR